MIVSQALLFCVPRGTLKLKNLNLKLVSRGTSYVISD